VVYTAYFTQVDTDTVVAREKKAFSAVNFASSSPEEVGGGRDFVR